MTIYDVLRHLVNSVNWAAPGLGDIEEHRRKTVALQLIDRLEAVGLLGQVAIDVQERAMTIRDVF